MSSFGYFKEKRIKASKIQKINGGDISQFNNISYV
jgi:hypothetical protein